MTKHANVQISMTLLLVMVLVASCAPAPVPTAAPVPPAQAPTAAPAAPQTPTAQVRKPQGTFRVALPGDAPHLDPQMVGDLVSREVTQNIYSTLVQFDGKGNIVADLAKEWSLSTDGKTWTFKLRDDVKFHDGTKLQAKDVKYTLDRLALPATKALQAGVVLGYVVGYPEVLAGKATELSGVKVIDPLTIAITFKAAAAAEVVLRAMTTAYVGVVSQAAVESGGERWFETKATGSGPFKLKSWVRGSKITVEANLDYYGGPPGVATVELLIVPNNSTSLAMYENGELDMVAVPLEQLERVRKDSVLSKEMIAFPRMQTQMWGINTKLYPPAADIRVRQAIAYAMDRQTMVDSIYKGTGTLASGVVPPGISSFDPSLAGYPYDPAKAKQLLADAGYPGGKGLPQLVIYPLVRTSETTMMAEMIAASLKQNLGMDISIVLMEFATWTTFVNKQQAPALTMGWTAGLHDPNYYLLNLIYSTAPVNRAGYNNPEYDKIVDQANLASDVKEAIRLFRQADALAVKDAVYVPIAYPSYVQLVKPYVKGLVVVSVGEGHSHFHLITVQK